MSNTESSDGAPAPAFTKCKRCDHPADLHQYGNAGMCWTHGREEAEYEGRIAETIRHLDWLIDAAVSRTDIAAATDYIEAKIRLWAAKERRRIPR